MAFFVLFKYNLKNLAARDSNLNKKLPLSKSEDQKGGTAMRKESHTVT